MKDLILNVSPEAAERLYRGETCYLPCSQIPDLAHTLHPRVYICENKQITGVAYYVDAVVREEEFTNSKKDHYGHFVAWEVMAERVFVPPRQLAEFGLKRPPEEWRWIKP